MAGSVYRPPDGQPLRFLHVAAAVLVVDKPAGLLTVPGRGPDKADCLLSRVQQTYPDVMIVHRLDMSTSGIVVMARGPSAQRTLSIAFQGRRVAKRYLAIVEGRWQGADAGQIDLPIAADWPNRPRQKIDLETGRPCLTRYRVIDQDAQANTTRIELIPVTGRSHQLRVHMASAGHPILGDDLYGTTRSRTEANRLMLHACGIAFADPFSGDPIEVESPPPF